MKDPYVYEDTGTLKNKLGIKDYEQLRKAFVKASDGEYSEYQYLYKIIRDSIQRETKKQNIELINNSKTNEKSEDIEI